MLAPWPVLVALGALAPRANASHAAARFPPPRVIASRDGPSPSGARVEGTSPPSSFTAHTPPGTWAPSSLPVPFVLALPRSRDAGYEAAAELDVALRAWQRAPCTSFRARFDGERALVAANDGINGVFFHDVSWPAELEPGAVAQTVVHTDGAGVYRDADIHINGAEFKFTIGGDASALDLRSVLVHEIGHALGLGHSEDPRATMFAAGSELRWRSLEKDDILGLCALYPGTGTSGCAPTPCPAPFLCVADTCQRPNEARDVCSPCVREANACEAAGDSARCVDIGEGITAGRVCGRGCEHDDDCGAGFRCIPTTTSGDRQCVSTEACRNGASPCRVDADCTGSVCRAGACVGAAPNADAGPDASAAAPDASMDSAAPSELAPRGGDCDCRSASHGGSRHSSSPALLAIVPWLVFHRRRAPSRRARAAR